MNTELFTEWGVAVCLVIGVFFTVVGSFGLIKLPDVYCRMHAATKASTLGLAAFLCAAFFRLGTHEIGIKTFVAILFAYLTAPVGAHMIAQSAYKRRVKMWENSVCDELDPDYEEADYGDNAKDAD